MLIVGGAGNNLGAVVGAGLVWALWSASGAIIANLVPPSFRLAPRRCASSLSACCLRR